MISVIDLCLLRHHYEADNLLEIDKRSFFSSIGTRATEKRKSHGSNGASVYVYTSDILFHGTLSGNDSAHRSEAVVRESKL